jgi:hypothetical protein
MNQIKTQTAEETRLETILTMCRTANISPEALPEILRYWEASIELCKFSTKLNMVEKMIERHLPEIQSMRIELDSTCQIEFRSKK